MTCQGIKKNGLPCTYKCNNYNMSLCRVHTNIKNKNDIQQLTTYKERLPINIHFKYCCGIISNNNPQSNIHMCMRSCIREYDGSFGCRYHKKQIKYISRVVYLKYGKLNIIKEIKNVIDTMFKQTLLSAKNTPHKRIKINMKKFLINNKKLNKSHCTRVHNDMQDSVIYKKELTELEQNNIRDKSEFKVAKERYLASIRLVNL